MFNEFIYFNWNIKFRLIIDHWILIYCWFIYLYILNRSYQIIWNIKIFIFRNKYSIIMNSIIINFRTIRYSHWSVLSIYLNIQYFGINKFLFNISENTSLKVDINYNIPYNMITCFKFILIACFSIFNSPTILSFELLLYALNYSLYIQIDLL